MNYTTLRKAAKALQISEHFLRTRCRANTIPYIRAGNRYMLDTEQVAVFLHKEAAAAISSDEVQSNE